MVARNFKKSRSDSPLITAARYASLSQAMSTTKRAIQPKNQANDPRMYVAEAPGIHVQVPSFDVLPDTAFVRQSQLIRDSKNPTRPTLLPFSAATFWRRVRDGKFPKPVKFGERVTAWKVGDVRAWLKAQADA